tara:strand:- start:2508 stop:2900 length:393 start_codon:yes stop_codon:yes gene_type:complete
MKDNFTIEIISPNTSVLKSSSTEVTIPSYEGQMGILKDHIPLITFLRPGLIHIKDQNKEKIFFVEDGIVEFVDNILLILTSTAKSLEALNQNLIKIMIRESEEKINKKGISDKENYLLSYKVDTLKQINK